MASEHLILTYFLGLPLTGHTRNGHTLYRRHLAHYSFDARPERDIDRVCANGLQLLRALDRTEVPVCNLIN